MKRAVISTVVFLLAFSVCFFVAPWFAKFTSTWNEAVQSMDPLLRLSLLIFSIVLAIGVTASVQPEIE